MAERARRRRRIRLAGLGAAASLVLAAAAAGLVYAVLGLSLPVREGTVTGPRLASPVVIERDPAGVPTLTGRNRSDVAFALGFLHAQERFFQMDLQRRAAAGELAELFGEAALPTDRLRRIHRFRTRAHRMAIAAGPGERAVLEAYAAGVNRGLAALAAWPFEYLLLGAGPVPWRPEDTILVALAMYVDLQEENAWTERRRGLAYDALGPALGRFLYPDRSGWDAPIDGSILAPVPIPQPTEIPARVAGPKIRTDEPAIAVGSNGWAVAGALTAQGGAIVANDMHLRLRVPNIWYRARLVVQDGGGPPTLDVTGVTLPGAPSVIAGSNGKVAWAFTNSYIDTGDVVIIEPAGIGDGKYRTSKGPRTLERHEERICVKAGRCETLLVEETMWGPVIGRDHRGRRLAYRWTAHEPDAIRLTPSLELEAAEGTADALSIARRAGMPTQNIVAGDRAGTIGWTLAGPVPRRFGHDGSRPTSWADGSDGWDGLLAADEVPVIFNPPDGRLWTANARVVGGPALEKIGSGGYAHASRAWQIRGSLYARDRFDEQNMLSMQLDDRALVLERWHRLMVERAERRAAEPDAGRLLDWLHRWGGRAAVDSVGYRLVRTFRSELVRSIYDAHAAPIAALGSLSAEESARLAPPEAEDVVWRLLAERPDHLLPPGSASWDGVIDGALDRVLETVRVEAGGDFARFTWGAANRASIRHPISGAGIPLLPFLLDAPDAPLPGDVHVPRVASPTHGASERFAVSPGHEEEGIFHMPGGQSGHPLAPYYLAGHGSWLAGERTSFLPGPTVWRLVLVPSEGDAPP